jgi:pimeloyl-ACP methyl ester carboxylesterase
MAWDDSGDIVVVLPGIAGSVLQRDGKDVFGLTVSAGLRALFSGGASIRELAVDLEHPEKDDGVTAHRLAPDAHLVPGLWKIDGYGRIVDWLVDRLHLQPGVDLREFPYDWRQDNRLAATRLRDEAEHWLRERRRTYPDARLVLLAHSMGGLVARYYLEVLGGWRDTRRLLTFGTPHRGALDALDYLVNGCRKAFGLVDLTALMSTFPSTYQLLPIYPCVSVDGASPVRLTELLEPIPGLDPHRVAAADDFHREIERAVARNRADAEYHERGYALHLVVGAEHPTRQSAQWSGRELTVHRDYPEGVDRTDMGGDGTVPRVSATPIELSDVGAEWFAGDKHAALQNAEAVLRQFRRTLLTPSLRMARFRATAPVTVALDVADVYPQGEPPVIRVLPLAPPDEDELTDRRALADLVIDVEAVIGEGEPWTTAVELVDDWREVELPVLEPGCYRVRISGERGVQPTTDLLVVAPPERH